MPLNFDLLDSQYPQKLGQVFDPVNIAERQNRLSDLANNRSMQQMQMMQGVDAMNKTKKIQAIMQQYGADPVEAVKQLNMGGFMQEAGLLAAAHKKENTLVPADTTVLGPDLKPVYTAPSKPTTPSWHMVETANGQQLVDANAPNAPLQFGAKPNKPLADVSVKIDNEMGEGIAKEIGPMMAASKTAAEGANQQMDVAGRLDSAIKSGKLYAGPGATVKLYGTQIGETLGLGGKDANETLANTRTAIQSLAQFSLTGRAALKGQGQISDYEGKLLAKATSGNIEDLTLPELQVISNTAKRVAKAQTETHGRNMSIMRKNPDLNGLADFYDVPNASTQSNNMDSGTPPPGAVRRIR